MIGREQKELPHSPENLTSVFLGMQTDTFRRFIIKIMI